MTAFLNLADSKKLYVEVYNFSKKLEGDPVSSVSYKFIYLFIIFVRNKSIHLSCLLTEEGFISVQVILRPKETSLLYTYYIN